MNAFPSQETIATGKRLAAKRYILCDCGIKAKNLKGYRCRCGRTIREEREKMRNEAAIDAFVINIAKINEILTVLQKHTTDHFDTNPDEIHWGDVGNTGHVIELLEQIAEFLGLDVIDVTPKE